MGKAAEPEEQDVLKFSFNDVACALAAKACTAKIIKSITVLIDNYASKALIWQIQKNKLITPKGKNYTKCGPLYITCGPLYVLLDGIS